MQPVRRALVVVLAVLLMVSGAAGVVFVGVRSLLPGDGADLRGARDGSADTAADAADAARHDEDGRRARRRVTPAADSPDAVDADPGGAHGGTRPVAGTLDSAEPGGGSQGVALLSELPLLSDAAPDDPSLVVAPERDPLKVADPQRVGLPPELAFTSFVTRGIDSIDGAAELVGERRPDLETGQPVALTGRVLSARTGEGIAGACVVVTSTFYVRRHLYDHHLREVARAYTDAAGEYSVPRVDVDPAHFGEGGMVYVTVTAGGFAPSPARPLASVKPGETSRLPDVRLAVAAHILSGRVLDIWEGRPVVGARVVATGSVNPVTYPKDQREALFLGAPQATTDADGRFELTGLGAGVQFVSVHGGDDCLGSVDFVVPRDVDVSLRMRGIRGRIAGRVVDALDRPVPLVAVLGGGNSTHSFADGSFVLENFREDALAVAFLHPDFRTHVLQGVADGTEELLVRMTHAQPVVRLRVRRQDDGAPLRHVRIVGNPADGGGNVLNTSPEYLAKDDLHVVHVPQNAATLTVSAAGLRDAILRTADLRDGDLVDVLLD